MDPELDGHNGATVAFSHNGKDYLYSYYHDSTYIDDSILNDFEEFCSSASISERLLVDVDDGFRIGGYLLPVDTIAALDPYKPIEY